MLSRINCEVGRAAYKSHLKIALYIFCISRRIIESIDENLVAF